MKMSIQVLCLLMAAAFIPGACGPSKKTNQDPNAKPVTIEYIGHSCVVITAPDGTKIVADPYGDDRPAGLDSIPKGINANAVIISHFHRDHSNHPAIEGNPKLYYDPGVYQAGMVKISCYKSDHGLVNNWANNVFVLEIGKTKIAHLGDAGEISQPDILDALKNADAVVFYGANDAFHPLKKMVAQMKDLNPGAIIPTHFSVKADYRYLGSSTLEELDSYVSGLNIRTTGSLISIMPGTQTEIVKMTPKMLSKI